MSDFRYTPRTVGTIKLHAKTMAPATIAMIMRCSVGTVELICRKHGIEMRDRDLDPPPPSTAQERSDARKLLGAHIRIYLDEAVLSTVAGEARRRGTAPNDLIARLVEVITDSRLFGAVLDR